MSLYDLLVRQFWSECISQTSIVGRIGEKAYSSTPRYLTFPLPYRSPKDPWEWEPRSAHLHGHGKV